MKVALTSVSWMVLGMGCLLSACASHPPVPSALVIPASPQGKVEVEPQQWLKKAPKPGDRFHVAQEDLEWTSRVSLGPAYHPTGSCTVTQDGLIRIQAPEVEGLWNCFVRVCREGCMVGHMQLNVTSD